MDYVVYILKLVLILLSKIKDFSYLKNTFENTFQKDRLGDLGRSSYTLFFCKQLHFWVQPWSCLAQNYLILYFLIAFGIDSFRFQYFVLLQSEYFGK